MNPPSISGYTTTYNCIAMQYPFSECLTSLLGFCDEVVVVDAGSTDGTAEAVQALARTERRVKFFSQPVNFSHPRWAIHLTGDMKAAARSKCSADLCWQIDTDEIVPEYDYDKARKVAEMVREALEQHFLLYLPMVEFWGAFDRIRADFFTVKLRLSKNHPNITHGIPIDLRMQDEFGNIYPRPFDSDGCDYIWRDSGKTVEGALAVDPGNFAESVEAHQQVFDQTLERLPSVLHVSWLVFERKIAQYRDFWRHFHDSKYNLKRSDTAEENVMFNKPWSAVTDADIREKAKELYRSGPRKFHVKAPLPADGRVLTFSRPIPPALLKWHQAITKTI